MVFVIYLFIACGVIYYFLFPGEGSTTPILIFGSWGVVLARIIRINIITSSFILIFYMGLIFYLNTILGRYADGPIPLVTGIIHASGCVIAGFMIQTQKHPMPDMEVFGIITSILVVSIYFGFDWILAMGNGRPASKESDLREWDLRNKIDE